MVYYIHIRYGLLFGLYHEILFKILRHHYDIIVTSSKLKHQIKREPYKIQLTATIHMKRYQFVHILDYIKKF